METQRQFVQYSFYKTDPSWRLLPKDARTIGEREFLAVYDEFARLMPLLKSYSLVGIRGEVDFMFCKVCGDLQELHALEAPPGGSAAGRE